VARATREQRKTVIATRDRRGVETRNDNARGGETINITQVQEDRASAGQEGRWSERAKKTFTAPESGGLFSAAITAEIGKREKIPSSQIVRRKFERGGQQKKQEDA